MSQVITNAFEQYWQSSLAAEQPVVLDEFILADIPNLDITAPIDPDTVLPPESQIVHRQNVDQRGRINNNAVAYTIVMDTTVGDFSFNAMYLRNKQNGVIGMIVYKGRETKLKTDQTTGQTGNSLVKSMLMGYDQAAEATLTNVDAGTWQIDYAARLRGQDEDLRQLASQLYGHHTFIGDGFKVVQQDGGHQVTQGVAIVGGLRIDMKQPEVIHPGTKPIGVWVDVHRSGSLLSEHQNHFTIITSVADLTDHVDGNGYQHYVAKLATVQADSTVIDGRGQGGSGGSGAIPDTFALWKRLMAEAGYNLIGQFGTKHTIGTIKQVLLSKNGTEIYAWLGALPKDVPADATLESTGGIGPGLWLDVGGDTLRNQHAAPNGSSQIGFEQPEVGAVPRTILEKSQDIRSTPDYGAVGDGVHDDTAAFAVMSALAGGKPIDGLGRVYLVTAKPTVGVFFNGMWRIGADLIPFEHVNYIRAGHNVITIGPNAAPNCISDDFIAIGNGAAAAAIEARNGIAIGKNALKNNRWGRHNLGFGVEALYSITGSPSDSIAGSRNMGFGGNAGRFLKGSRNLIFGRDAGHNLTDAHLNLIMGVAAVMGDGPNTLDPGVIENQTPLTPSYSIMLGAETGKYWNAGHGVGAGHQALMNVKSDTGIVGIGSNAFSLHQSDMSHWGTTQQLVNFAGTYSQSGGTAITVTIAAHGLTSDFRVLLRFTSGANGDVTYNDDNWFVVTVIDSNTFTIQSPVSAIASGNVSVSKIATTTPYSALTGGCVGIGRDVGNGTRNYRSTGVGDRVGSKGLGVEVSGFGYNVFLNYVPGAGSTAAGAYSQQSNNNAGGNTSFGVLTMAGNILTGVSNEAFGAQALRFVSSGSNNAAFGGNVLRGLTTGINNTGAGNDALRFTQSGLDHNFSNCSGFGYQSYVSGDNQVQLGNSATTTYVYGTVQNRSDIRDKADIRNTQLGIEFIMGLRPVDGRWDMRDDYIQSYPEEPEEPRMPEPPVQPPAPGTEDIRIYHLDGDSTNAYSRVIETGSSGYSEEHYQILLTEYQKDCVVYETKMTQYQAELVRYESDLAVWERECVKIREYNARVATGEARDGSKKRTRYHHWFVAQEVKALCDKLGVEFGGYQDHSINDGDDVLTLGYDEFIPPAVRAVQQCWNRMDELDARLAKLEIAA